MVSRRGSDILRPVNVQYPLRDTAVTLRTPGDIVIGVVAVPPVDAFHLGHRQAEWQLDPTHSLQGCEGRAPSFRGGLNGILFVE
jgi:hypothetical protein